MTHGAAPAAGGWKTDRNRKTARQIDMRQRRNNRDMTAQLRERYDREVIPRNDDAPLPRID